MITKINNKMYNLLDFNENIILENVTEKEIENFLENKESALYLIQKIK